MSKAIDFLTGGSPWLIQGHALNAMLAIAQRQNNLEAVLQQRGEPLQNTRNVTVRDGVAIIPVNGPLFPRANLFDQVSGATSVEILALDLQQAAENPDVRAVVLNFDSPGGHVTMINEFAAQIKEFEKPVWAYVTGAAASGSYWLASATDKIVMDRTAIVGSIGVKTAYQKSEEEEIEILSSNAPDKSPDPETDSGRAVIVSLLDDLESVFIETVMTNRGMSREQVIAARGGVMVGTKAVEAGFADEIGSLEGVIKQLKEENPMDLETLQADHPEVFQAAVDQGKTSAMAEQSANAEQATAEASTAERQRISAILGCEAAAGRGELARYIAFDTDMTPEAADKMLAKAPLVDKAKGQFSAMDAEMAALNPDITPDGEGDPDGLEAQVKAFASLEA